MVKRTRIVSIYLFIAFIWFVWGGWTLVGSDDSDSWYRTSLGILQIAAGVSFAFGSVREFRKRTTPKDQE